MSADLDAVEVGQILPSRTLHVTRAMLVAYAGASLDRNPIHWDERFAQGVGLPDVIAHGMFIFLSFSHGNHEFSQCVGLSVEIHVAFDAQITGRITLIRSQAAQTLQTHGEPKSSLDTLGCAIAACQGLSVFQMSGEKPSARGLQRDDRCVSHF